MAVSAGGVSLIAIGGLFVWSGLANAHPLDALHALVAGTPIQLGGGSTAADLSGTLQQAGTGLAQGGANPVTTPPPPGTSGTPALNGLNIGGF